MDRIATYYNRKNENQRLFCGRGELEFLRTKQIIEQFLPDGTGLSIVDAGGGSGPYAFWLAEKGHKVALFDLMPNHVEEAVSINKKASNPLTRIETADVRFLELESQQYDVGSMMVRNGEQVCKRAQPSAAEGRRLACPQRCRVCGIYLEVCVDVRWFHKWLI